MDELCNIHALKLQANETRLDILEKTVFPIQKDVRTIKNIAIFIGGGAIINVASQLSLLKIAAALIGLS
jgi:hypothetical protein